jgi:Carbohydrate binding domain/Glycosyl hydrolases family 18
MARMRSRRRPATLVAALAVTALAATAALAVDASAQAADAHASTARAHAPGAGVGAAASAQLLSNPSFETGSLSGWNCSAADKVVSGPVGDGSYALSGTPTSSDTAQCSQTVAVQPNSSYTLSAQVQGAYVYLGASGTGGTDPSAWTPSSSGWSTLSTSFTTGASTTSVTVWVHGWYGQGTFGADGFSLTGPAGGGTTTPPPTSPPPAGSGGFRHPVYFMPLDNSPQSISDIVNGSGENQFLLSFVLDSGNCTPAWDGESGQSVSADTTVLADVNAIRAAGGDVGVSFGGYNGTELGATCGSSAALANAYQQVVDKYHLTRVDLDWEGDDLDANMSVRWAAIKTLEQDNPGLTVSLTLPMTTVGLPDTGKDEIRQAIADGARIDVVNIMDFDFGLTSGTETAAAETVANDVNTQLQSLYGWDAATAWAHTSIQLMNGHTDQPSELFTQDTFDSLLSFAQADHAAALSYWDVNRDRACDPSVPHNWADGACSSVTQSPWDFTKIITQYNG